jgi:hypothetical protein
VFARANHYALPCRNVKKSSDTRTTTGHAKTTAATENAHAALKGLKGKTEHFSRKRQTNGKTPAPQEHNALWC